MIRLPPRSTRTDTLSLHDALPIFVHGLAVSSASKSRTACQHVILRHSHRSPHRDRRLGAGHLVARLCGNFPHTVGAKGVAGRRPRSEEHTSELQSLMRISYAVFCLKKKKTQPSTATMTNVT